MLGDTTLLPHILPGVKDVQNSIVGWAAPTLVADVVTLVIQTTILAWRQMGLSGFGEELPPFGMDSTLYGL